MLLINSFNPKNLEVKEFAQNHTVIKGWSQNSTPGTVSAEPPNQEVVWVLKQKCQ